MDECNHSVDSTVCVPGEWEVCSLPGLQDSDQAGDDWTSCCCAGSYGATRIKTRLKINVDVTKVILFVLFYYSKL